MAKNRSVTDNEIDTRSPENLEHFRKWDDDSSGYNPESINSGEKNASELFNRNSEKLDEDRPTDKNYSQDSGAVDSLEQTPNKLNYSAGKNNKPQKAKFSIKGNLRKKGPIGLLISLLLGGGVLGFGAIPMMNPLLVINGSLDASSLTNRMEAMSRSYAVKVGDPPGKAKSKAFYSKAFNGMLAKFGVSRNPTIDIRDSKKATVAAALTKQATEGDTSKQNGAVSVETKESSSDTDQDAQAKEAAQKELDNNKAKISSELGDLGSTIEDDKKTALAGNAKPIDTTNPLAYVNDADAPSITDISEAKGGTAAKVINFVGGLAASAVNTACTLYNISSTAVTIGRIVAVTQIISYGMIFISTAQAIKAGDANPEVVSGLINTLINPNESGDVFSDAPAMQSLLFNAGKAALLPIGVNVVGGVLLAFLSTQLKAINNAMGGRQVMVTGCGIAGNIAFQIVTTAIGGLARLAATVFTGGAGGLAVTAVEKGLTEGIKIAVKEVVKNISKDLIASLVSKGLGKELFKEGTEDLSVAGLKSVLKNASKKDIARTALKTSYVGIKTIGTMALLILGPTLAVQYLSSVASGGYIGGIANDSKQTGEAIYLARSLVGQSSAISAGGSFLTPAQNTAYSASLTKAIAATVNEEKQNANPLDMTNQYSLVGSMAASMQLKTLGSPSIATRFLSLIKMPSQSFNFLQANAAEGTQLDNAAIADLNGYDPEVAQKYALDVSGNPLAGFTQEQISDINGISGSTGDELATNAKNRIGAEKMPKYDSFVAACTDANSVNFDPDGMLSDEQKRPEWCDKGNDEYPASDITIYKTALFYESMNNKGVDTEEVTSIQSSAAGGSTVVDSNTVANVSNLSTEKRKELAIEILKNTRFNFHDEPQLRSYASSGEPMNKNCYVSDNILTFLYRASQSHKIAINSLNRKCTGSSSAPYSLHPLGKAVDIGNIDDVAYSGGGQYQWSQKQSQKAYEVAKFLPPGGQIGQSNCRTNNPIPSGDLPGIAQFGDTCHHVHFDIKQD